MNSKKIRNENRECYRTHPSYNGKDKKRGKKAMNKDSDRVMTIGDVLELSPGEFVRQGDVLIVAEDWKDGEQGWDAVKPQGDRYVLATGESTGHMHTVEAKGTYLFQELGGRADSPDATRQIGGGFIGLRRMVSEAPVTIQHQRHLPLTLKSKGKVGFRGTVRIQSEYSPQAIRNTAD